MQVSQKNREKIAEHIAENHIVFFFCEKLMRSGPGKPNQRSGQFMNFSQGHSGTKVQCESRLFARGKTPEFTKMGEIHELFVLALSLAWFAGATPELNRGVSKPGGFPFFFRERSCVADPFGTVPRWCC